MLLLAPSLELNATLGVLPDRATYHAHAVRMHVAHAWANPMSLYSTVHE